MKKINIILIILLSCLGTDSYAQKKDSDTYNNCISSINLFVQQSALCIKKHALMITLTPLLFYHHEDIKKFVVHSPYISSFAFYLLLHSLCDSVTNYQQQQFLLNTINLLKKTTLYLVISHGIKNHISEKNVTNELFLSMNNESFLDIMTEKLPYSFDEVTLITLKSYQELKAFLQSLNTTLHIESEEFVFLCHASSINMQSLLYLVQDDPIIYELIYHFEKDPELYFSPLVDYLKDEIYTNFKELEQQLLISHEQSQALS